MSDTFDEERIVRRNKLIEALDMAPDDIPPHIEKLIDNVLDQLPEVPLRSDVDILARMGTDAEKWAEEFMQIHGDRLLNGDALGVHDTPEQFHDTLRGWFANAIGAGEQTERARLVDHEHHFPMRGVWLCEKCGQVLTGKDDECHSGAHAEPSRAIHSVDAIAIANKLSDAADHELLKKQGALHASGPLWDPRPIEDKD